MDVDAAVAKVAEGQLGLITQRQALRVGMTHRQMRLRVERGRWSRLHHGVFLIMGSPRSWPQTVLGAVLAGGDGALASHTTAARLWHLPIQRTDAIEISVPIERFPRLRHATVHRTGTLHELDLAVVSAVPTTSPARVFADLSSALDVEELGRCVDDALRRGIVSLSAMHAVTRRFRSISPGRSPKKLEAVMRARIPGYDPGDSDLETRVWETITRAGLPTPVRLHRARVAERVLTIDLAYPSSSVAIEIDGFAFHAGRRAFDLDRVRQNALVLAGWKVLRFTSRSSDAEIIAAVTAALFERQVTPSVT